jgi:hypothetical protein
MKCFDYYMYVINSVAKRQGEIFEILIFIKADGIF